MFKSWLKKRRNCAMRKRTEKGTVAVEFALIAPALLFFFIGIMEMSLMLLTQHIIENATYNASRLAKTGYVGEGETQQATVMAELNERLGGLAPLIDVNKIQMTSAAYADLSAIGQPDQGEEDTYGSPEQVVVYTVSYPWTFFTPLIGDLIGDENRQLTLTSRIVVRNEPYD